MRPFNQTSDKIESEALDGILLLKKEDTIDAPVILATLNGIGKKEWKYKKYLAQNDKNLTLIQVEKTFLTPAATSHL